MALYEIKHEWQGRVDIETRKRRDSAEFLFRVQAREMVAGWAGLDTQWGWNICSRAAVIGADFFRGVPVGHVDSVKLADCHGGESLTIRRVS